ncbi:G1 family glutamic endopeptidase [Streptomyces puniciscabiei]
MPLRLAALIGVCTGLALITAAIAPALDTAGPAERTITFSDGQGKHSSPHSHVLQSTSGNWAGYAATGTTFTSVSTSWTQPAAHCANDDTYVAFWAGLDGDGSNTVEQTGTEVDCTNGTPQYSAWYEMYPDYPVYFKDHLAAGDHLTASVTANGKGSFTLQLTDTTQGWSHTKRARLRTAQRVSAEIIAEAPSDTNGPLPLANFGTVQFTGATINGKPAETYNPDKIHMVDGTTTKATTSPLTNGQNFTITWDNE